MYAPAVAKRDQLVRFGVAMEASLLKAFDAVVRRRSTTRSSMLRDLARASVTQAEVAEGADAVATVTIVYDHHVKELSERLTELGHSLGSKVRSSMHVHLDRDHCLDVTILQGPARELRTYADKVFATRGVKHGAIEVIATSKTRPDQLHVHVHSHAHQGEHEHTHEHGADHNHPHPPARAPARRAR
jgi:CopG family transcriptional regulator, nickel-responsive regulator